MNGKRPPKPGGRRPGTPWKPPAKSVKDPAAAPEADVRLNRYIANAGICSRREADGLISSGVIRVNGKVVTELGTRVKAGDRVQYKDKLLQREKLVYVLLNKPKGFITTTDDPHERKTVMHLVEKACQERIYPVGRLDRNTTGLLLFTNDGALSKKLTHPSHGVKKIYKVTLDKPLEAPHLEQIRIGLELEDGRAVVDALEVLSPDRRSLGIELHIGKNRVVRRIFETLGYEVLQLDRVAYAGLTKKDLPRGKWRYLSTREIVALKFLG
jgi:23S rRNA pseudouridine2605 synthase